MKKITLAIFAAVGSITAAFGQNLSVLAPPQTNNYYGHFLTGTQETAEYQGIFLITPSELSMFTTSNITGIDVPFLRGVSAAVNGTCEVYLENTNNTTYNLGWPTFTAVTNSMTLVYTGALNINAGTSSFTVPLNFPTAFPYSGGGVHLAIKWAATNPAVLQPTSTTNFAAFPSHTVASGTYMGGFTELSQSQVQNGYTLGDTTDIMYNSGTRPCFLFKGVNTATNEVSVSNIFASGKVARNLNDPQEVVALVENRGIAAVQNVTVSMNITGVNPFSDTQVIPNLPIGGAETVTFSAYTPTTQGNSTITISVPNDDNNFNNVKVWTQSVSCNIMGNNPPSGTYANSGLALQNTAITGLHFLSAFNPTNTQTLTAVRAAIGADAGNAGKHVYGVLIDANDISNDAPIPVIATTNTITLTGSTNGFQNLRFDENDILNGITTLNGGGSYFIGFVQEEGADWVVGILSNVNYYNDYVDIVLFNSPTSGNAASVNLPDGYNSYMGIEPVLGPVVTISQPNETACTGEPVNLGAEGGVGSYTWTAVPVNASGVTVSNRNDVILSAAPANAGTYTYTLRGADEYNCTNTVSIVQMVDECAGIKGVAANNANITLYPNPAVSGKTEIHGLEGKNTITVYNMLGQQVVKTVSTNETVSIDLSNFPSGNYVVRITNDNNQSKTMKFVNQN